jgi:hypothetical protein
MEQELDSGFRRNDGQKKIPAFAAITAKSNRASQSPRDELKTL